ncbi:hypothetical protein SADUNF_Sadunf01G0126100 [Salix dunnii]|uniref:Retrotransposon Copia-like N-terminal domain-containing protein n=1 Tax=Salix dunnii TaxID=1413687 RepID=A0A835NC02_9ROSI|nr:hypothetical protein SADUNF_Sadunf01G0126100 [Salix dunnii]
MEEVIGYSLPPSIASYLGTGLRSVLIIFRSSMCKTLFYSAQYLQAKLLQHYKPRIAGFRSFLTSPKSFPTSQGLKQQTPLQNDLASIELDGTNYMEWALNAQNKIRGRKLWGFISGSKAAPNDTNSEEYEGKLQKLWQKIDAIDDCAMSCKADIEIYTTKTNCQDAMMGGISTNGNAMATRRIFTRQDNKKGTCKCTHYNDDNHVVDTCFKLHGYPEWHPKGKKNFANTSIQQQPMSSATRLIAQTGIPTDENNSTMDTPTIMDSCPQDKTMDTSTTIDPCSQD